MNDLQQATPRATLGDDQNNKLQADVATLEDAQQARRQGQSVDQGKVQSAFDDIVDQDFTAIQPPQPRWSSS
jgi:hypothetical protein